VIRARTREVDDRLELARALLRAALSREPTPGEVLAVMLDADADSLIDDPTEEQPRRGLPPESVQ
jgi:hypothetical protein